MAEYHHPGADRRQRPQAARRGVAASQQYVAQVGAGPEGRQTPGSRNSADQRVHGADAPARADRRRPLLDPRLFRRQSAAGARALRPAFPGLSHLSDCGRPVGARPRADFGNNQKARADWFAADEGIFEFLRDTLTMDLIKPGRPAHSAPRVRRFALKVQQFTGPMMAKSLEDTAFYRYHRLLALNEVGGDPSAQALSIDAFHEAMKVRAKEWPHGMTATATHDTKRGEDARARLMALAEIPGEWASAVARWKILNAPNLVTASEMRAPSAAFEYMLYQVLLGAWPSGQRDGPFLERMQAYALKAAREGKQETSWLNPNEAYEAGLKTFIARILDRSASVEFLDSLETLAQRVALLGALNSLSQIALKATMPGVPDFYQGTEFWDLSLVDPDNRRPVDFAERAAMLSAT